METFTPSDGLDPGVLRLTLPEGPGVSLFKDGSGQVIYIGKAKNLKKRVLSYFKPSETLPHKTAVMMERARSLAYILTATEKEAFILEDNLVKKRMPRYNIILRDDKQYLSLRLDTSQVSQEGLARSCPTAWRTGLPSTSRPIWVRPPWPAAKQKLR